MLEGAVQLKLQVCAPLVAAVPAEVCLIYDLVPPPNDPDIIEDLLFPEITAKEPAIALALVRQVN